MRFDTADDEGDVSIDLTPLIDVVFLLVLFFAVTTSFISPNDLQALYERLVSMGETSEQLEERAVFLNARIEVLETDLAQTREARDTLAARNEALQAEAETRAAALEQATRSLDLRRQEVLTLETDFGTLQERVAQLERRNEALGGETVRLTSALEAAETALTDRVQEVAALRARLETANSRIAALEASEEGLETVRSDLAAEAAARTRLQAEVDRLAQELERRSNTLRATQTELGLLRTELAKRTAALEDSEALLADNRQALQAQNSRIEMVSSDLEAVRGQNDDLQLALAEGRAALEEAWTHIETLTFEGERQRAAFERERASWEETAGRLNAQIVALETEKLALSEELARLQAEVERVAMVEDSLNTGLESLIEDDSLDLERVDNRLTLQLSDRILFDPGRARLKQAGLGVLGQVGAMLKERIGPLHIQIGGHTDSIPMRGGRFADNWELSAERALNVVRFFEEQTGIDRARLSAVAFGDTKPIASNETAAGRSRNRRIEIVLLAK